MKRHCLARLVDDNCTGAFHDPVHLLNKLLLACHRSGMHVLQCTKHEFHPAGLTAVVLLSESHAALHTYPEHNMAYLDVFSCGDQDPEHTVFEFAQALGGVRVCAQTHARD